MVMSDLSQVLAIERACFPTPWTWENFRFEIHNPCARSLVVRRGTEVLAYVCVWIVAGELKINNIAVRAEWRRRGLGAALLERVLRQARSEACEEASLEVRPSNRAAERLYRRYGFRRVGRKRRYYLDTGEDAVLMAADLKIPDDKCGR